MQTKKLFFDVPCSEGPGHPIECGRIESTDQTRTAKFHVLGVDARQEQVRKLNRYLCIFRYKHSYILICLYITYLQNSIT